MTDAHERIVPLKALQDERAKVRKLKTDLAVVRAQNAGLMTFIEQNPSFSLSACVMLKASLGNIP